MPRTQLDTICAALGELFELFRWPVKMPFPLVAACERKNFWPKVFPHRKIATDTCEQSVDYCATRPPPCSTSPPYSTSPTCCFFWLCWVWLSLLLFNSRRLLWQTRAMLALTASAILLCVFHTLIWRIFWRFSRQLRTAGNAGDNKSRQCGVISISDFRFLPPPPKATPEEE